MTRICLVCNSEFEIKSSSHILCSDPCRREYDRARKRDLTRPSTADSIPCVVCGVLFKRRNRKVRHCELCLPPALRKRREEDKAARLAAFGRMIDDAVQAPKRDCPIGWQDEHWWPCSIDCGGWGIAGGFVIASGYLDDEPCYVIELALTHERITTPTEGVERVNMGAVVS